jgi:hypothetical protein
MAHWAGVWIVPDERNLPPTSDNLSHLSNDERMKNLGERPELIFAVPNACIDGKKEYYLGYFDGVCFHGRGITAGWQKVAEYYLLPFED